MSKAEKMFRKLGYEKEKEDEDDWFIVYTKDDGCIVVDKRYKEVCSDENGETIPLGFEECLACAQLIKEMDGENDK